MPPLWILFELLAARTWERLELAARYGVSQGETSITDWLLLELAMWPLGGIKITKTQQHEERTMGTDWEWWIGSSASGRWLRYAVQAKRININTSGYHKLSHKVGERSQRDILADFASANGAIPLYCFYNTICRNDYTPFWNCPDVLNESQLGCSVTSLSVVDQALSVRGRRQFDWIHKQPATRPWRCLVKCPLFTHPILKGPLTSEYKDSLNKVQQLYGDLHVYSALPDALGTEAAVPTQFDRAFYNFDLGLYPNRIAIIDLGIG